MTRTVIGSLARIADFGAGPYELESIAKTRWQTGDYVMATVTGRGTPLYHIEDCNGDLIDVEAGDRVLGALGVRAATLEGVGSWMDVEQGHLHALTSAGLFGRFTSLSRFLPQPMSLDYVGHVLRGGCKSTMTQYALRCDAADFDVPTIFLVGTSMSAGKTLVGALICEVLASAGRRVIGAKLTGAGRYRDILRFSRAGACETYDFVDAGLPSTVVPEDEFRTAIRPLLAHIASRKPEFLVAEAGASPIEPYNGAAAFAELGGHVRCTVLCASDPYAVVGVQQAFDLNPDLVTGPATNTSAAIDLVEKLSGVPSMDIHAAGARLAMRDFLVKKLGVELE